VTRRVCEKIAQNGAKPILCQVYCIPFSVETSALKFWIASVIFKKLLNINNRSIGDRRAFAQSVHPDLNLDFQENHQKYF
jgi:hypothetical protein